VSGPSPRQRLPAGSSPGPSDRRAAYHGPPMAVTIASDLHKEIAGKPLLRGVSFKLERRERMTIAGRNGAGKTTLLRMLAGEESIDKGELSVQKGARVALHDQRPPRERAIALREYVLSGCAQELQAERELAELERKMGEGFAGGAEGMGQANGRKQEQAYESTLDRYARAQARLEALGGYLWRDRATVMTRGLGFAEEDLERPLDTFSGGQLTRASLARALATNADVLLLDEPTNHLDIESLEWLEQTLTGLDAAIVLVAHDRWFLEAVGTAVLELEAGRSRFFAGSWHNWRREQAAREIAQGKAIDKQQAEIARMERFIERFRYKATKAKQAQSRVKKLAKIERIERDPRDGQGLEFAFKAPERSGRVIFELTGARVEVGGDGAGDERKKHLGGGSAGQARSAGGVAQRGKGAGGARATGARGSGPITLLEHAELWLERGEHVSLVGPNGSGKTTLIETLAGQRPLAAGKLGTGHNVKVGYLSQHADELGAGGPPSQSVLDAAQRATGLTPNKARALLGQFLFSGEEAEKPLAGLSGGERRRLSLAVLVHSGANVLILDEPTNHLDIESREALEDALQAFQGAVLLVSHDRALLDAVGTRTVAVEGPTHPRTLRSYEGGWPEYVRVREERRSTGTRPPEALDGSGSINGHVASTPVVEQTAPKEPRAKPKAKPKGPSKNRLNDQQQAELAIEAAEVALREVEDALADPAAWATKYESAKSEARHTAARRAVEAAYARLEALVG
jgi:ATP-binding cassette subfamily F protein 3